jgi:ribonuclease P protein component
MGEAHVPTEQAQARQESRFPAPHVDAGRPGHPQGSPPQGPQAPVGLIWRLRGRQTFVALRRSGRRSQRGPITITWAPVHPTVPPQVGFAVGTRVGGAVQRNRLRRRLRAIATEVAGELTPGAYLIGAAPEAATLPFRELRTIVSDMLLAAPSAGRRAHPPASPPLP